MSIKYIVTGTGRCGTVYFSKLLTSLGITCGHETVFSYDGLNMAIKRLEKSKSEALAVSLIFNLSTDLEAEDAWFPTGINNIQADSSYMAAPFLDNSLFDDVSIIHLIRHPLDVINSFLYGLGYFKNFDTYKPEDESLKYHRFIYNHIPVILNFDNPIDRAAVFYIEWNKMIERNSKNRRYIRFKISKDLKSIFKFLNIDYTEKYYNNNKANHIGGLKNKIFKFDQIPSVYVRRELELIFERYFKGILFL